MFASNLLLASALPFLVLATLSCTAPTPAPTACGGIHPKWTLDPLSVNSWYTYTSPSASGPKLGSISFDFQSDMTDYTLECAGSNSNPMGTFYGTQWFDCKVPGGESTKATSFSYDSASKVVNVTSTWTCGGDVVYRTTASGIANLECNSNTWTNPDWESGELYSNTTTICGPGNLVIQV